MNEYRESFKEIDATEVGEGSYDFHIGMDESGEEIKPDATVTVEFEEFEANSEEELEAILDERAKNVLEESEASVGPNVGYEVVKEYGDTYRKCGFAVIKPHLE